ncbi:MAG TPA: tetratricopeptide repeat protein, partial [Isosphaeraceae bacterium]|nr:tetratricopeptide repeat protein [Isosphaeraceae bacterium]
MGSVTLRTRRRLGGLMIGRGEWLVLLAGVMTVWGWGPIAPGSPAPARAAVSGDCPDDEAKVAAFEATKRGNERLAKGDLDGAIEEFTKAIQLDPKIFIAYVGRGHAYDLKKDYDKAIGDYTEAIKLRPEDEALYNFRGSAYRSKGDYDSALADHSKAIELRPKDPWSYFFRAQVYELKDLPDRAIDDLTRAIEVKADFAPA